MTSKPLTNDQMILNTSDEAAKFVTVQGWVSRDGHFYGNGHDAERIAKWGGCTHIECPDCKTPTKKGWTHCDACREKRRHERYMALPLVEWDGVTPLCIHGGDEYFFDLETLYEYCEEWECKPEDLDLVICKPQHLRQVDEDYWSDDFAEEIDLPLKVQEALRTLNMVIKECAEPTCWWPADKRVSIPSEEKTDG